MSTSAITVSDVSKRFRVYSRRNQSLKGTFLQRSRATYEDFWALQDVDFEIPEGKTFGLLGHNGSGKSTLLKCIAKILTPDSGSITARGRMAAMLEVGSGFHPELSGRENIFLNGAILGMDQREIQRKFDDIVDFSGSGAFIDQPVKNYSSWHVRAPGLLRVPSTWSRRPARGRGSRRGRHRIPRALHG